MYKCVFMHIYLYIYVSFNCRKPSISRVLDTQMETDIVFSTLFSLNIHFRCLNIYFFQDKMFHGSEYILKYHQLMIGLDPWNIFSWKKYIFKHLKCIFKLNKVENTINMLAYSWSNGWTELAEIFWGNLFLNTNIFKPEP